ncbi:hypothetical protein DC357_22435 [Vibrio vulnificus]|nr:hypothetical protein DC357_22435 [Vibrio vulnificus]
MLAALNLSFVIRQETIVLIRMSQWNNTKSHIENGKNHWPHFRFAGLARRRGKFCAVTLVVNHHARIKVLLPSYSLRERVLAFVAQRLIIICFK